MASPAPPRDTVTAFDYVVSCWWRFHDVLSVQSRKDIRRKHRSGHAVGDGGRRRGAYALVAVLADRENTWANLYAKVRAQRGASIQVRNRARA